MSKDRRRSLSDGEAEILGLIQEMYGSLNQPGTVFFSDGDEAMIFVQTSDGGMPLMANLTFLADEKKEGASLESIRDSWLTIGDSDVTPGAS